MGNRLILIVIVKVPDESFHKLNRTTMMGSVCDRRIMLVQREKVSGFHVPSSPWSSHNTWMHDDLGLSKVGSTSRNALPHFLSIWWASVFSLFNWKGQLHLCHLLLPCPGVRKQRTGWPELWQQLCLTLPSCKAQCRQREWPQLWPAAPTLGSC